MLPNNLASFSAADSGARRRGRMYPIFFFSTTLAALLVVNVIFAFAIPLLRDAYADSDIALPAATAILFNIHAWIANPLFHIAGLPVGGWIVAVPAFIVAIVIAFLLARTTRLLFYLFGLIFIGIVVTEIALLLLPYFQLMESLMNE